MLPIPPNSLLQQRYRILEILGEGKSGRTYLATDNARASSTNYHSGDEYCAIEELIPSTQFPGTVAKAKESFKQSAELLYQLQHPQIPRLWATFEEQNRLFLVQDYIEGKTYGQVLDNRRDLGHQFSEFEVWQFLLQILPALGYMHSKSVIHRNLSPDNIIRRDTDNLPVPIEFGVVKEFAAQLQSNPAQGNATIRQSGYTPPEQLQTGQADPHSDLYALAVTAIVLLTGKEPVALFEGDLISSEWRRWTRIGDGFFNILQRMLSPQPTARYQSANEVFQALQSLNIPDLQPPGSNGIPAPQHPSELPTMAVGGKRPTTTTKLGQTGITNLNIRSVWEKPQVFIPLGVLISLLAGVGSWFGVTHLMHSNRSTTTAPVASNPPKQIDFNNPTIPTDNNPTPSSSTIEPTMGQSILKEGTVSANTPTRYRITAVGGQNLDIQLVNGTQSPDPLKRPSPDSPNLDPTRSKKIQPTPTPSPSVKPLAANQVLMTILTPSGTPIDAQADRVVGWRGEIPVTGDYTIELRPIAGLTGSAFPYKLSVTQLAVPTPNSSGTPYGTTPPVVMPMPNGGIDQNSMPSNSPPNSPNNNLPTITPVPVPIQMPTTSPAVEPEPKPERPKNRTPRRNRIEEEQPQSPKIKERRRPESDPNEEAPPPRRRSKRPVNPDTPKPTPSVTPESDGADTSKPKSEPAMTPPTSDNQAPQPNTTDGGNSNPPAKTPKPSPSAAPNNTPDTD
jgi:serine/threonine protein kinase